MGLWVCHSGDSGAENLPSSKVMAVDNDKIVVRIATANARLNGTALGKEMCCFGGVAGRAVRQTGPYDVILANILAAPYRMAPYLAPYLAANGWLILFGYSQ